MLTIFLAAPIGLIVRSVIDWRLTKVARKETKEAYRFKHFLEVDLVTRSLFLDALTNPTNESGIDCIIRHFNNATRQYHFDHPFVFVWEALFYLYIRHDRENAMLKLSKADYCMMGVGDAFMSFRIKKELKDR
jgi:hypothetical protein